MFSLINRLPALLSLLKDSSCLPLSFCVLLLSGSSSRSFFCLFASLLLPCILLNAIVFRLTPFLAVASNVLSPLPECAPRVLVPVSGHSPVPLRTAGLPTKFLLFILSMPSLLTVLLSFVCLYSSTYASSLLTVFIGLPLLLSAAFHTSFDSFLLLFTLFILVNERMMTEPCDSAAQ